MLLNVFFSSLHLPCTGGSPHSEGALYFQPTILSGLTPDMELFKEEIFGPVISAAKFASEEDVIRLANDTRVGLASYFYSNDVR